MGQFEKKQIDDIINQMLDFTGARTAQLAQDITISLAEATPRDTGLASAAWVPSRAPGTPGRVPARNPAGVARTERAQERAVIALTDYQIEQGRIFVGNPIPYSEKLDEGSSPQARPGFVARVAVKALADANRKK